MFPKYRYFIRFGSYLTNHQRIQESGLEWRVLNKVTFNLYFLVIYSYLQFKKDAKKDDVVLIVLLTTLVPLAAFTALLIAAIYIKKSLIKKPELVEMTNIQSR